MSCPLALKYQVSHISGLAAEREPEGGCFAVQFDEGLGRAAFDEDDAVEFALVRIEQLGAGDAQASDALGALGAGQRRVVEHEAQGVALVVQEEIVLAAGVCLVVAESQAGCLDRYKSVIRVPRRGAEHDACQER